MSGSDRDLVRLLTGLADFMEAGIDVRMCAGLIRQAARRIVEHGSTSDACVRCGRALDQPDRGRRRQFCSDRCRKAAWRRDEKGLVGGESGIEKG